MQNTGIKVVFNVGRTAAEQEARALCRIDPLRIKHEVTDDYAVERTHPVYSSLSEQLQRFTEYLQDMPKQHFVLKAQGQGVKVGKSLHLPKPQVDPQELLEVEPEYLNRSFRPRAEAADAARVSGTPARQPINRRKWLIARN